MLFFYKTLQRKHGPPVQLLQPTVVPDSVCGLEMDTGDDYWILGNGKGHAAGTINLHPSLDGAQ